MLCVQSIALKWTLFAVAADAAVRLLEQGRMKCRQANQELFQWSV